MKRNTLRKNYSEVVALYLTPNMRNELQKLADNKGIPLATYLRWQIIELLFDGNAEGEAHDE